MPSWALPGTCTEQRGQETLCTQSQNLTHQVHIEQRGTPQTALLKGGTDLTQLIPLDALFQSTVFLGQIFHL